ncbi:MAG: hypothetical protein L3K52_05260 [Candidatus Thiothrix sulfatifontis]|nr:MAG: hypothetical protein L3K52_05260 [Candidatus Thiothrix sulfatifontis]
MHILGWLMKHPILLAWLLAIIAILLNFSMGTKSVEDGNEVAMTHESPAAEHQAAAPAPAPVVEEKPVQVAANPAPAPVVEEKPVQAPAPAPAPVVEEKPVQAPAPAPAPAPVVEEKPVQAAAPAPAPAPVVEEKPVQAAAPAPVANPADLLRAAREAYWANELDKAVGLYNDLLKQAPDSLEYQGELANVYWKQGNAQQAATLFAEVAPKLAAQGRVTEALNMKLYVDMVNPELAKQIDAALKK